MKKTLLLAMAMVLSVGTMMAQPRGQRDNNREHQRLTPEQMIDRHVAKMQNKLMLSDKDSKQFASTYKEYLTKLHEINAKDMEKGKKAKGDKNAQLSDAEILKNVKARYEKDKKVADLKLAYVDKFSKFLSARQVEKVMKSKPKMHRQKVTRVKYGQQRMMKNRPCGKQHHQMVKPGQPQPQPKAANE